MLAGDGRIIAPWAEDHRYSTKAAGYHGGASPAEVCIPYVVLARNGVAATGSPWWVDSLNVLDGETYDVAFVATNPGIWLDHCNHLKHAADGMVAHLMYEGISTPHKIGGTAGNRPE